MAQLEAQTMWAKAEDEAKLERLKLEEEYFELKQRLASSLEQYGENSEEAEQAYRDLLFYVERFNCEGSPDFPFPGTEEEPEQWMLKLLANVRSRYGDQDLKTADEWCGLAWIYESFYYPDRKEEAASAYREALRIREAVYSRDGGVYSENSELYSEIIGNIEAYCRCLNSISDAWQERMQQLVVAREHRRQFIATRDTKQNLSAMEYYISLMRRNVAQACFEEYWKRAKNALDAVVRSVIQETGSEDGTEAAAGVLPFSTEMPEPETGFLAAGGETCEKVGREFRELEELRREREELPF